MTERDGTMDDQEETAQHVDAALDALVRLRARLQPRPRAIDIEAWLRLWREMLTG